MMSHGHCWEFLPRDGSEWRDFGFVKNLLEVEDGPRPYPFSILLRDVEEMNIS